MLPEHHHPHDKQWLIKQFDAIPVGKRGAVSHKYSVAYRDAHAAEPVEHLRDNVARRTANTRLRVYIEQLQKITLHNISQRIE